jgi:hypothetical protein
VPCLGNFWRHDASLRRALPDAPPQPYLSPSPPFLLSACFLFRSTLLIPILSSLESGPVILTHRSQLSHPHSSIAGPASVATDRTKDGSILRVVYGESLSPSMRPDSARPRQLQDGQPPIGRAGGHHHLLCPRFLCRGAPRHLAHRHCP